jgi:hypothetical protein
MMIGLPHKGVRDRPGLDIRARVVTHDPAGPSRLDTDGPPSQDVLPDLGTDPLVDDCLRDFARGRLVTWLIVTASSRMQFIEAGVSA